MQYKSFEKAELFITSNFSFSHNVFHLFGELSAIFIKFENVIYQLIQFEESKICRVGNGSKKMQQYMLLEHIVLQQKALVLTNTYH